MPFAMSGTHRAGLAALPDDAFPDVRGVWDPASPYPLGELPKAGNGLWVLCATCWDQRWLGGEEICRKWPDWLLRPGPAWARALRCHVCERRRFVFMSESDPAAAGFQRSSRETAPIIYARRLATWLMGGPVSVYDLAPYLAAMPSADDIRAAGI